MIEKIKLELRVQGSAVVWVDRAEYELARDAHHGDEGTGRLDRLLQRPISEMDTEVTVTESDGTSYDL